MKPEYSSFTDYTTGCGTGDGLGYDWLLGGVIEFNRADITEIGAVPKPQRV